MQERQGQCGYKNIAPVLPHFSYHRFYKIKVKIFPKLIVFQYT